MRQKHGNDSAGVEKTVRDIRRATRQQYSSEEKIRIVLEVLHGEDSVAELRRREGINQTSTIDGRSWRRAKEASCRRYGS